LRNGLGASAYEAALEAIGKMPLMDELTDSWRAFLAERRYAVLATHDPSGEIRLTPIWFLFENDRFHFASSSKSRKVKNIERTSVACVVVDSREPGRERWISGCGPVEIVRDDPAATFNARVRRRYLTPEALDSPIEAALAESDDVTLSLAPTTWRSWSAPVLASPERLFLVPEL
jgi:PPOX class probable F420-dependent enzyme